MSVQSNDSIDVLNELRKELTSDPKITSYVVEEVRLMDN